MKDKRQKREKRMYFPLNIKTHFSLLRALNKPEPLVEKMNEVELEGGALCDFGLSGSVEWFKANKGKKCILGTTLNILHEDRIYDLGILARNHKGWKTLTKISSRANSHGFVKKPKNAPIIDGYPTLTLEQLQEFNTGDLVGICGGPSSLASLNSDSIIEHARSIFPSFYLGLDKDRTDLGNLVFNQTKDLGAKLGIKTVAYPNVVYLNKGDEVDHRVLLYSLLGTTVSSVNRRLDQEENALLKTHFQSSQQYLKSHEEMLRDYSEEELERTCEISSLCEEYSILSPPILPKFECPNRQEPIDFLKELCREGWRNKIQGKIPKDKWGEYGDRVNYELSIIEKGDLASYFLIVWDLVRYSKEQKWMTNIGRGSAAGSLVSFLLNIVQINPIKYNLLFERFLNPARLDSGNMAADIDLDFPIEKRDDVYNYIAKKYGQDKVGQMATYQTIKGRGALKNVLKVYGNVSFDEMNRITDGVEDEAKIIDELQELKDEGEDASILGWALNNKPEKFKEWCEVKDGKLDGPLALYFDQAIRLENTKYSRGRHPAGIVIGAESLVDTCPMIYDTKSKNMIISYDLKSIGEIGLTKLDALGISSMSKVMKIKDLLKRI